MKKMLSFLLLITGVCLSSFSQVRNSLQKEPFKNFSTERNMERFRLGDAAPQGKINDPFRNSPSPEFSTGQRSFSQNQKGNSYHPESIDAMPCIKPQGNFPMPVYQPDSTIRFSLLIKKIGKGEMLKFK